jgi:hypothetical protein
MVKQLMYSITVTYLEEKTWETVNNHPTAKQCLSTYGRFDEGDTIVGWEIMNHLPYSTELVPSDQNFQPMMN